MAKKAAGAGFDFREADARAKAFPTAYYSADLHKDAQALPPFVAEALAGYPSAPRELRQRARKAYRGADRVSGRSGT